MAVIMGAYGVQYVFRCYKKNEVIINYQEQHQKPTYNYELCNEIVVIFRLQTMIFCNRNYTTRTIPRQFAALLSMLSVTHIMSVLVLLSVVGGRNAAVHDLQKNEMNKLGKVKNGRKYAADNKRFKPLSLDKIFSPTLP